MVFASQNTRKGLAMAVLMILALSGGQKAEAARQGELRPVRATVGCVEIRNWENNILKSNPNLRHYHWNPIYANVQGTRLVGPPPPPRQCLTSRGKKHEVALKSKKHTTAINSKNYLYRPVQSRPSVYKKPTQIAPQRSTGTQIAYRHVAPSLRSTNTSIGYKHVAPQLSNRDTMGRLIPPGGQQEPTTAVEAELRRKNLMAKINPAQAELNATPNRLSNVGIKSVNAQLAQKECTAQLAVRGVEGQLIAKTAEAKLVAPVTSAATYAPYNRNTSVENYSRGITKTAVNAKVSSR
jgi:hypothetical protein